MPRRQVISDKQLKLDFVPKAAVASSADLKVNIGGEEITLRVTVILPAPTPAANENTAVYPRAETPEYDAARLSLRDAFRKAYHTLSGAAKTWGNEERIQFSVFNREGMIGLYGGLDTRGLSDRKKIRMDQYWDHAGIAELTVNVKRIRQTLDALDALPAHKRTVRLAMDIHKDVGRELRAEFIKTHKNTPPERLPVHPHLKLSRQRQKARRNAKPPCP